MPRFLHVGCGPDSKGPKTPGFEGPEWSEVRFDINPSVSPDLIGTMTDMSAVKTGSMDAIFSSHNIEHLYPHEVPIALEEFKRVLTPDGFVAITCPDILSIAQFIAARGLGDTAYMSTMGPITPLDMLYGHQSSIRDGKHYMAHRCGFTAQTLQQTLQRAGFGKICAVWRPSQFVLWAIATKANCSNETITTLARRHIPDFARQLDAAPPAAEALAPAQRPLVAKTSPAPAPLPSASSKSGRKRRG